MILKGQLIMKINNTKSVANKAVTELPNIWSKNFKKDRQIHNHVKILTHFFQLIDRTRPWIKWWLYKRLKNYYQPS